MAASPAPQPAPYMLDVRTWRGESGEHYACGVYPVSDPGDVGPAIVLARRIDETGTTKGISRMVGKPVALGTGRGEIARVPAHWLAAVRRGGATTILVHLCTTASAAERARILSDLGGRG